MSLILMSLSMLGMPRTLTLSSCPPRSKRQYLDSQKNAATTGKLRRYELPRFPTDTLNRGCLKWGTRTPGLFEAYYRGCAESKTVPGIEAI